MTTNRLPRRSLLTSLAGSIAGLAAGLMGGRTKAENPRIARMKELVVPLKPVLPEPVGHEYQVIERVVGDDLILHRSYTDFADALAIRDALEMMFGGTYCIRKRPVGAWEMMQLSKS